MITTRITLENFIKQAPVCQEVTNLEELLKSFVTADSEKIAIVNLQNYPVGAIDFRALFPYLFELLLQDSLKDKARDHQGKIQLDRSAIQPFIKPIATLPAQMSLQQFCSYWQAQNGVNYNTNVKIEQDYAIISKYGEFAGFLDTYSLIKFLLGEKNKSQNITKNNLSQYQQLPLLFSVLEKLPLPLSLETARGVTLYQNLTWREKIVAANSQNKINLPSDDCKNKERYLLSNEQSQEIAIDMALEKDKAISLKEAIKTANDLSQNTDPINRWQFVKLPLELSGKCSEKQPLSKQKVGKPEYTDSTTRNRLEEDKEKKKEGIEEKDSIWLVLANEKTQQQIFYQELAAKNADNSQLNHLKNELLASISHELKSPLTSIVGLSTLLQEKKIGELNQRQNRYAEQIYRSGRQLMILVNQLLDLTALDGGQLQLSLELVNITNVCQQVIASIRQKYRNKIDRASIKLSLDIETNLGAIEADELRLEQMLVYLLEIALTLSETREEIGLRVERFCSSWIGLTVWNTGKVGLAEDFQYLAFEQMLRSCNVGNKEIETTGLGLVLTQRLAKAQGGDVTFICSEAKGNEFKILLRQREDNQQQEIFSTHSDLNCPPQSETLRDRLVLIVESIARQIENLTAKLRELGFRVIIARSGIEAISKARRFSPGLIFLNPDLPLLEGWEVLRLLKLDLKTKDIPVFITSKLADKDLSLQNGANGFLSLPINKQVLQKILIDRERETYTLMKNLTILCLHAIPEKANCICGLVASQLNGLNHRIIEADCLEQAEILARIWQIDVIVLEGNLLENTQNFLRSLSLSDSLASLPLVTMDAKTTEAANQIKGLAVFPCLVPLQEQSYSNLLEVIQIAVKIDR